MNKITKIFGLVFLCIIWGVNWVAIKISLEGLPPLISANIRFLVAILALYFFIRMKGYSLVLSTREYRVVLASAFFLYVVDYGCIFWGEQYLSAGVTAIFFSTYVLFTAIFSNFLFKNEPFRWNRYVGLLVGFLGIVLIFYDQLTATRFETMTILGSVAIIVSAVGASISTLIVKKHLSSMNTAVLNLYQLLMGIIFLVLLSAVFESPVQVKWSWRVILAVLYMGVMASAVAFVINYRLLKQMSAISLSMIVYIIPLVALATDFLIYNEILPFRSFAGMVVIFGGIWLSQWNKHGLPGFRRITGKR